MGLVRPHQVITQLAKSNTVQIGWKEYFWVSHVIKRNEGVELAQNCDFVQLHTIERSIKVAFRIKNSRVKFFVFISITTNASSSKILE